jgi:hypothetical protein
MIDPDSPLHSLMPILLRFSSESAAIRQLVVEDEAFRGLAEDYLLAHNILQNLQKQRPAKTETIEEYAMLLRDLEGDINKYLARWRGGSL